MYDELDKHFESRARAHFGAALCRHARKRALAVIPFLVAAAASTSALGQSADLESCVDPETGIGLFVGQVDGGLSPNEAFRGNVMPRNALGQFDLEGTLQFVIEWSVTGASNPPDGLFRGITSATAIIGAGGSLTASNDGAVFSGTLTGCAASGTYTISPLAGGDPVFTGNWRLELQDQQDDGGTGGGGGGNGGGEEEEEEEDESCNQLPLIAVWQQQGGGPFFEQSNWEIEQVPSAPFRILFADGVADGGEIVMDADHLSDSVRVRNDAVSLVLNATQYVLSEASGCPFSLDVSAFEPSFLEIKGGVVDAQSVRIGGEAGEQGRLRLDTTRFSSATLALIGDDGRGQVDIERAIFRGVDVRLARNVFADGFVTVNGVDAQLEIDASLIVAERGSASLAIEENGELRLNNEAEFTIGMHGGASGSSGRVVVSDAGRITGASVVTLGEESGARGELEIFGADSSAVVTLMFVGQAGEGSVAVADGGFLKSDQLRMALDQGARATVEVIGAGPADEETVIEIERFTTVGEAGPETAALSIRNGGFINGGIGGGDTVASTIAANPGSRGIVTVEGDGSVWQTRVLHVGFAGTADLFIRDQAFVKSDDAVVGNVAGAIGDVEIVGDATWEVDGILDVAPAGIGRIQVRAGGFLNANELIAGPLAVVTVDGIAVGPGDDTAARRFRQAQFANPSGIRTDRLVIAEGAEIIADTIALRTGGELAGDGALDVDLTNSGTMTPGVDECSAGKFTINGNYAQAPDATLRIKLGGTRPGSAHDVLDVAGQATLAGTLHVDAFDGFRPREDQSFEILTASSINGEFDAIAGSGEYVASYETNRVILTVLASPTEIGEPCPKENTCGAGAPCGAMGGICMWAALAGLGGLRVRRSGVGPLSR